MGNNIRTVITVLVLSLSGAALAHAGEFTSASFKVSDPVFSPSGFAASSNFQLWSSIAEIAVGTSTASSFGGTSGFLFFPHASTPVVSASGGNAQVSLSWTSASASGGWTVGGYSVGQSTISGGPYSYTALGSVTSSTRTGLTNGTTYYFVIVAKDAFGNFIATSTQVSATPANSGSNGGSGGSGGGGGGGGGGGAITTSGGSSIFFTGRAYPRSTVTLLKDAQVTATTVAGADAKFSITLSGLSAGNYIFSVYGEDTEGIRSSLLSFPVSVTNGVNSNVGGIFITPSISTDKSEVKRGDTIVLFGQSAPQSDVVVSVHSEEEHFINTKADAVGAYLVNFDTSFLELGSHSAKSKAAVAGEISSFSKPVTFTVGTKNIVAKKNVGTSIGDANGDERVNIVDFSMTAYWYRRPSPPSSVDLNGDGTVDLRDLSIMAYHWTG